MSRTGKPALRVGAMALLLAALFLTAVLAEEPGTALVIGKGSVARDQVVALGRDLVVDGEALADVAVINGTVRIGGSVAGNVIVLGGDALLGATARVRGDVFVLGGRMETASGAEVEGRSASYATIGAAWLTLFEGPSLGLSPFAAVVLGAKFALLAAWLALVLMLFATAGMGVVSTSESVSERPFRNFFIGLTGVLCLLLTALFLSAFAPSIAAIPLLFLVVLFGLLLKLWGMAAVFRALGEWVGRHLLRKRLIPLNAAVVGLLVLGALKFVPWVGTWVWTAATLIGVGAALTTKFGRREPWFEAAPPASSFLDISR